MKYDNIAVVIRGHKRVWDYSKHNIFAFYESIANKVDYYVSLWPSPNLDLTKLEKDFSGRNLIALVTPPLYEYYGGAWRSQSWLPYHILPYKKIREKTVKYDTVFDQRTDEIIYGSGRGPFKLDAMTVYSNFAPVIPYGNFNPKLMSQDLPRDQIPHVKDYGFMSDSATYDLLTHRFAMPIKPNFQDAPELMFAQYLHENNITPVLGACTQTSLVRPDICKFASKETIYLIPSEPSTVKDVVTSSFNTWNTLTRDERKNLCLLYDIEPGDYFL